MVASFFFIGRVFFLAPTLDNDDQLLIIALVINTPVFYLHHVEVVDQDPASGYK